MQRRNFVRALALISASPLMSWWNTPARGAVATGGGSHTGALFKIPLTTPGRIGFYVDYSELDAAPGTHRFYVCRTHGTEGQVSVEYVTEGDSHATTSGTLTWANGEAGIKSFSVAVPSKPQSGEHRLVARLRNPSHGAVLHYGPYSAAYGIIDDGSISTDAIFYDAEASEEGDGTETRPFNNIYKARDALTTERYLYGRGRTIPDRTDGDGDVALIRAPSGRVDEDARLIVRNWPGSTWQITGGGGRAVMGFFKDSTMARSSFITYRGMSFEGLDTSGLAQRHGCHGIWYNYGGDEAVTVERCVFDDLNGRELQSGFAPFGVKGFRVWRSTFGRVAKEGNTENANTTGILTYVGTYGSVQRCTFNGPSSSGIYHKKTDYGDVSTAVRFCLLRDMERSVWYSQSGAGDPSHSYTIVEANLHQDVRDYGIHHQEGYRSRKHGEKHWWCNNVFVNCGKGIQGAINFHGAYRCAIFNNVFLDCRRLWCETKDRSEIKTGVEYADFNLMRGTTYSQKYRLRGKDYSSASALCSAASLACHDNETSGVFAGRSFKRDNLADDLHLDASYAMNGIDGTNQGVYRGGFEVIGAEGARTPNPVPRRPDLRTVE